MVCEPDLISIREAMYIMEYCNQVRFIYNTNKLLLKIEISAMVSIFIPQPLKIENLPQLLISSLRSLRTMLMEDIIEMLTNSWTCFSAILHKWYQFWMGILYHKDLKAKIIIVTKWNKCWKLILHHVVCWIFCLWEISIANA